MRIDAHTHLFPHKLAEAIRRWFDQGFWDIQYRIDVDASIDTLTRGGIDRLVALPYAHKPGVAAALNTFTRELAARRPEVLPCCTVFPGEEGAERMLDEALSSWARGVKMHAHVMRVAPDDPRMEAVWRASARHRRPVVIHCGPQPTSEGYGFDTAAVSGAHRLRRVLEKHPEAIAIVPHLGVDEHDLFEAMLAEFPNLYLDTTMAVGGYFSYQPDLEILRRNPGRILYGTDFPNLPYEWTRELRVIESLKLPHEAELLGGLAARLFGSQ